MSNQTIKNYFPTPRIIVISMWVIYLLLVWLVTGYINAVIDNKIYIVYYKSTDQMDNSLTPYYSSRQLNSISIVKDFPDIEYDLVENYSDLVGNN